MKLRSRTLIVAATLLSACFIPTEEHNLGSEPLPPLPGGGSGSGVTGGGSGGGGGLSGFQRCVQLIGYELLCTTVFPVVCGGVACASGEVCCQTTGACVARGSAACPNPPSTAPNNPISCGSNADCASDHYCVPDEAPRNSGGPQLQRCVGGSGHCQPLANCAYCGAPGSDRCQVCGCDGVTYASDQVACVAGVSAPNRGRCGVPIGQDGGAFTINCGRADQCPAGAQCCFGTGKCFDNSEPWRCAPQPNGSILNCATDSECNQGGGGGSGNEPPTRFCAADACGGSPGICAWRGSGSSCGGEVQTVCGCDGITYVNACWARAGGTRIADAGTCP